MRSILGIHRVDVVVILALLTHSSIGASLQQREGVKQVLCSNLRIDTKLLRQIAEHPAHLLLLLQHVEVAEADAVL